MLLGEGRGSRSRRAGSGPGRIHHCMRVIGVAERALEAMCQRLMSRTAFGKKIYEHSLWEERIADARIDIECSRLLTLKAALHDGHRSATRSRARRSR
jgi:acyl-CoA dehydrogenase